MGRGTEGSGPRSGASTFKKGLHALTSRTTEQVSSLSAMAEDVATTLRHRDGEVNTVQEAKEALKVIDESAKTAKPTRPVMASSNKLKTLHERFSTHQGELDAEAKRRRTQAFEKRQAELEKKRETRKAKFAKRAELQRKAEERKKKREELENRALDCVSVLLPSLKEGIKAREQQKTELERRESYLDQHQEHPFAMKKFVPSLKRIESVAGTGALVYKLGKVDDGSMRHYHEHHETPWRLDDPDVALGYAMSRYNEHVGKTADWKILFNKRNLIEQQDFYKVRKVHDIATQAVINSVSTAQRVASASLQRMMSNVPPEVIDGLTKAGSLARAPLVKAGDLVTRVRNSSLAAFKMASSSAEETPPPDSTSEAQV